MLLIGFQRTERIPKEKGEEGVCGKEKLKEIDGSINLYANFFFLVSALWTDIHGESSKNRKTEYVNQTR